MLHGRESAVEYAHKNRERFLDELISLVNIPSISTQPAHKGDIQLAATWIADQLTTLGMQEVQIIPTGGHPVVYAQNLDAGKDVPIVLIYGHYDVQPPDPLEL